MSPPQSENDQGSPDGDAVSEAAQVARLDQRVEAASKAVAAIPQDHPNRAGRLNNLGNRLRTRFERTGSMDDLTRAVDVADMAVAAMPKDHPDRAACLNNLGAWLGMRFKRAGSMDDLTRAVDVADMAVAATPKDHPDRAGYLNNLGTWLGTRFERTGSIGDLTRAVNIADIALAAMPKDHPNRAGYLNNLGTWLGTRFERTGSMGDLTRAVDVADMALAATPQDHPDRAVCLNNLGNRLGMRFQRTGSMDDLNRAVDVADMAVAATPKDHPRRAARLNNLGNRLSMRFKRTSSIDDLTRAIDILDMAVDATQQDYPNRAGLLDNLGNCLSMRFQRTGSTDDINRALSLCKEGWNCRSAPPSIRISLARNAAYLLASKSNWQESSQLLQEAVNLLPTVSPRTLQHTDKQHMLADFAGLASAAAATALNARSKPYHALQLLELGRDVIAGLLMDMRGDVSNLEQEHPGFAHKFVSLRNELDKPLDTMISLDSASDIPSWVSQARRRNEADQEFNGLIASIRALPGFDNFLLPPTADELMAAADPDPIAVINLSPYRCDAFLVKRYNIQVLKLESLTLGVVQERARDLRLSGLAATSRTTLLLEWLWDSICRPVLEALGLNNPVSNDNWPRLWWVPTGALSQLPLHAAGRHVRGSRRTVLDRVMSSYASSIKALLFGRQRPVRSRVTSGSNHALLVAMGQTPGLAGNGILPFASAEVEMVNRLCPSLQVDPVRPPHRKGNVIHHLRSCRIFHFAGHGRSDPMEPSQSYLLLEDWDTSPLTVGDLRELKLHENPPFLAYLSACSTGTNEAENLADEGIHLISAFRLAGFRHVIGTLWEVSDRHCVDVARVVYETMRDEAMTDVAVCRGLHRAVRALRDKWVESELAPRTAEVISVTAPRIRQPIPYWVPYVHFGA